MRDPLNNKMFGATLASGLLSGLTLVMVPGAVFVGPGILFAVASGWIFYTLKWLDLVQVFVWIVSSSAAWYVAMRIYTYTGVQAFSLSNNGQLGNMLPAGFVGSLIVAVVFSLLIRKVSLKNILITVVCGIVLAYVMYLILTWGAIDNRNGDSLENLQQLRLAVAFAAWQIGIGFSLLAYKRRFLPKPRKA
jgi:hypothetical protein